MGEPSLKIPSDDILWESKGRLVFVTREPSDRRYYVWVRSPRMVEYGYTTGYAWTWNSSNKAVAIKRAKREVIATLTHGGVRPDARRDARRDPGACPPCPPCDRKQYEAYVHSRSRPVTMEFEGDRGRRRRGARRSRTRGRR